ncbi:ABC transporter permease, partial [bacterium]|nr:ABC transporter permease [bacterium]
TNLYYTATRFNTAFSGKSKDTYRVHLEQIIKDNPSLTDEQREWMTNLKSPELLREIVDSVGAARKAGEQIQHVIAVAMLSEGWDTPGRVLRDSSRDVGIGDRQDLDAFFFLQRGNLPLGDWLGLPDSIGPWFNLPMPLVLMFVLAAFATVFLHQSVFGRYLFALGFNEQAARYAGIRTDRHKTLAYVLCSLLAGLGGILFLLKVRSASPSNAGSWFELYAITGAVLGGFSLRGGEGMVVGILLGTAILPLLRSFVIFAGIPSDLEFTVIGLALLLGTIADEIVRRQTGNRFFGNILRIFIKPKNT